MMNAYLNYLIEANLGLLLLLIVYKLLLHSETNFQLKRIFLLTGIIGSLLFPLIHVNLEKPLIPSVQEVIPSYWLPEVTVGNTNSMGNLAPFSGWTIAGYLYLTGLSLFTLRFFFQLYKLSQVVKASEIIHTGNFRIALSNRNQTTFSFFRFIFIGQANELSENEKQQIIQHETVHARQWHSLDIVLVNLLGILFWFNPFVRTCKNILIQLHEFEADAHVAESHGTDEYASLLAKVALRSAGLTLANHFNSSLTLKRISMMKTMKRKIKLWKIVTIIFTIPTLFFIISCQDQLVPDSSENKSIDIQAEVEKRFAKFRKDRQSYPGEIFTVENYDRFFISNPENYYADSFAIEDNGELKKFAIVQALDGSKLSFLADDGKIFTEVERIPEYEGGFTAMTEFILRELKYPTKARVDRKEGTVFVQFVVEKDGSISNVEVIRGVEESLDAEAVRVVKLTKWTPGYQDGKTVRTQFVLPVKYKL